MMTLADILVKVLMGSTALAVLVTVPALWRHRKAMSRKLREHDRPTDLETVSLETLDEGPHIMPTWLSHYAIDPPLMGTYPNALRTIRDLKRYRDAMAHHEEGRGLYAYVVRDYSLAVALLLERHEVQVHGLPFTLPEPDEQLPPINSIRYTDPEFSTRDVIPLLPELGLSRRHR